MHHMNPVGGIRVTGATGAIEPLSTRASGTIGAMRTMGAIETIRGIRFIGTITASMH